MAWLALNSLVGGILDPSTKDRSRLHYLPSTFDPAIAWTLHNEGRWLDPDSDLPRSVSEDPFLAQVQARGMRARLRRMAATDEMRPAATAVLQGTEIAPKGRRHDTVRALTWWMAERALPMAGQKG